MAAMTREVALALLGSGSELTFEQLGDVFLAFGFKCKSPTWDTEVYYHEQYADCGMFTARDDGHHVLSPIQREIVRGMVLRAFLKERLGHKE